MRRQKGTHGLRHDCSDGHSSARGRDALGNTGQSARGDGAQDAVSASRQPTRSPCAPPSWEF